MITLSEVYRVLNEGTAEEVAQLQAQITTIDTQIQRTSQPLMARKNRLSQMLAAKQRALGAEQKRQQPATPPAQPNAQQQDMQ